MSRVLKPPGGGTSDIFGASEGGVEQSPRRIRATNHLQSSVFAANETSEPPVTPRNKPGNDSHNRLFGPSDALPQSATINRMKSSIPFGKFDGLQIHTSDANDAVVENGQQELLPTPKGGNPVTGEGYSATNGEKEGSSSPPAATTTTSADIRRSRVPPGGFSSGLW
ncbi:Microtubule-associated protein Jupiter [Blattella germanica]|nr:Microtubule-associated protein Jupiter [Blattella germanica]